MAESSKSNSIKKLAALQATLQQKLPGKIDSIKQSWRLLCRGEAANTGIADLHRMAHSLVGFGGTFGAAAVRTAAHELETEFKSMLDGGSPITGLAQPKQTAAQ